MNRIFSLYIFVFLICTSLQLFIVRDVAAQNTEISVKQAIQKLSKTYNIKFSYSSDKIDLKKKIKFTVDGTNLNTDLNKFCTLASLKFVKLEDGIVLSPITIQNDKITISGFVREKDTKEHLPEIIIQNLKDQNITYTNNYGYYSMTIPYTSDTIIIQSQMLGYKPQRQYVLAKENIRLDWELESILKLEDIEINDQRIDDKAFHKSIMIDQISDEIREKTPRFLGEKDVLAATRYYSGVNRETDLSAGYTIRGGSIDQNLIIIDDAPIYHAFHSFGMYSVMNEDALKQMNLIKSGFPARYGGRLSSVVELITKDGDMQHYRAEIGTGLVASKLSLQGPILKDKLTFLLSGRTSHVNSIIELLDVEGQDVRYVFNDYNLKLAWKLDNKNRLFFSAYTGNDKFSGTENTKDYGISSSIGWGNQTATLRWNHIFHPKWFANASLVYTDYESSNRQGDSAFSIFFGSGVRDYILKYDVDYFMNERNHFKMGAQVVFHRYTPSNSLQIDTTSSLGQRDVLYNEEFAFYIEDEHKVNEKLSFNAGLRLSGFQYKSNTYAYAEPRLLTTYLLSKNYALKASYGRMIQYAHFLNSPFGVGLPTDIWIPSTDKIKPQISDQLSLGVFYNNKRNWRFGIEAYYKTQHQIVTNAPNSNILNILFSADAAEDSSTWDQKVISGEAKAYGVEAQLEYKNRWFGSISSYTLAYAKTRFDQINNGDWFWANTDRRHNFSTTSWINITNRWTFNLSWIYTTGIPFTLPESSYISIGHEPGNVGGDFGNGNNTVIYFFNEYKGKNIYRMSSYHRLDVNFAYKVEKESRQFELILGVMNAYNRKNPIYYYVGQNPNTFKNELRKIAFIGIMPTVSLYYKF